MINTRRVSMLSAVLFLLLVVATPLWAQGTAPGRIVGRVTVAESGAPLSEAQVFLPGTGLGSLSRQNGTFVILEVPAGQREVRVERIGMAPMTQQVTVVAGQAVEVNFQLATEALGLDEIVVTGTAGAARRREIGNSISQLNVAELQKRAAVQTTDFLSASAPGIKMSQAGGEFGGGFQIRLRGVSTVSMSTQPIIYIDGIRMQSKPIPNNKPTAAGTSGQGGYVAPNPLNTLNPNDIERIEVIKGSAATTLYGTEASAGVIQIFTKRGSAGAAVWVLDASHNLAWLRKVAPEPLPYNRQDIFARTGHIGSYGGSVRGGGQALQYFGSIQYEDGFGQFPSDSLSELAVRGNLTATPATNLQFQGNSSYSNGNLRNTPAGGNQSGIFHTLNRGVANAFSSEDPAVMAQVFTQTYTRQIQRYTLGGTATYTPLANLSTRLTIGNDFTLQELRGIRPFGFVLFTKGSVYTDTWQNRLITVDYVGTYSFNMTSGLRSSFSWGGQAVGEDTRRLNAYGEGFPGATDPTVASTATRTAEEGRSKVWNAGFFIQDVVDIRNRYFVTLGMRVDGNSAFGSGFGLQLYPKASASWVISDEGFWPEGWGSMKLRTAYGQSGRAPGAFDATRTWRSQVWAGREALVPENLGNADIGPEVSSEIEAGLDGEWLGGRMTASFTYYQQTTSDALFNVRQVPSSGFQNAQRRNVGKIGNKGIELSLAATPVSRASLGWDVGVNITTNSSEVLSLGGLAPFNAGGGWIEEGYPVPVLRGKRIVNPDAIADPIIEDNYIYGAAEPQLTVAPSTSVRLPGGVIVSALGEYRGRYYTQDGSLSSGATRGSWMPFCWPYYVNPYNGPDNNYEPPSKSGRTLTLKPDTPAKWRAMCSFTLSTIDISTTKADFFRLRSLSAQLPLDFALPDRVSSALLTVSLNNSWTWKHGDTAIRDPDMGAAAAGDTDALVADIPSTVAIPTPITASVSLRIQF